MQVDRWPSSAPGRSRVVSCAGLVWAVANARDPSQPFEAQVAESLQMLGAHLQEAGSAKTHILSLQVLLSDIAKRSVFDSLWQEWIGSKAEHWPQRACFQAELAPGLQVELVAVAAIASASQQVHAP
ncbi:Rid family hydrolase [Variovorax terrae]|uniref:Rid family hydrolase n=1 Tax=Variovorax terrae TaxID=2923278 RepID=UPI003C6FC6B8